MNPNPPDFQLYPHILRPTLHHHPSPCLNIQPITTIKPHHHHHHQDHDHDHDHDYHQNPKKKRTKMIRFHNTKTVVDGTGGGGLGASTSHAGGMSKKKPDPSAPKITRPCTECGKRFWSWKALFGHMRCHPERPWRGINPPPNVHHAYPQPGRGPDHDDFARPTEEDEYVAACLLMLANTPIVSQNATTITTSYQQQSSSQDMLSVQVNDAETRFECSSCKKVFGSHQALGGHRASHKNVKGCFAITRNDAGTAGIEEFEYADYTSHCDRNEVLGINQQHKCSTCLKIFPSGQALGGHKRCHLEKEDGVVVPTTTATATTSALSLSLSQPFRFDLNSPAPVQEDSTCSSSDLDLRLCL